MNTLLFFAITQTVLAFTPGPAVLLVISQGMKRSFRASLGGAIGILTGNAIYFALSAFGLGAVLLASHRLFEIVQWLGAGYLIYMGARMLFARSAAIGEAGGPEPRRANTFLEGLLTQLANPKAIVFFTALLPQFVDPKKDVAWQMLVLGILATVLEFPVLALYGAIAARGRALFTKHALWVERIAGGLLVTAGAKLALARMR
jgi:homoserine/homoserine lactone efflux protein